MRGRQETNSCVCAHSGQLLAAIFSQSAVCETEGWFCPALCAAFVIVASLRLTWRWRRWAFPLFHVTCHTQTLALDSWYAHKYDAYGVVISLFVTDSYTRPFPESRRLARAQDTKTLTSLFLVYCKCRRRMVQMKARVMQMHSPLIDATIINLHWFRIWIISILSISYSTFFHSNLLLSTYVHLSTLLVSHKFSNAINLSWKDSLYLVDDILVLAWQNMLNMLPLIMFTSR